MERSASSTPILRHLASFSRRLKTQLYSRAYILIYRASCSEFSSPTVIECGVPQGSVLGPILFLLYIADLQLLIEDRGLCPHHFADDTQIYGFYENLVEIG